MEAVSDEALKQILLQQLRGLQRAGVTGLPHASVTTHPAESVPQAMPTPESKPTMPRRTSSPETAHSPKTGKQKSSRKGNQKQQLATLCSTVADCTRCQELAETRNQTVFGVGNPKARVLFLGEAPGADEDEQGIPFVGRAGKLMDKIIEATQLKRDDIYICNILKCRPPGNRNPAPMEASNCREYLDEQLAIINPEYIVCWGAVAAQNLLGTDVAIGKLRGSFQELGDAKVLCTYHPAYLLRNPPMKKEVWKDMQMLMAELGLEAN